MGRGPGGSKFFFKGQMFNVDSLFDILIIVPDEIQGLRKNDDHFTRLDVQTFLQNGSGNQNVGTSTVEFVKGFLLTSRTVPIHPLKSALTDNSFWTKIWILDFQVLVQNVCTISGLHKDQNSFLGGIRISVHLVQVHFQSR